MQKFYGRVTDSNGNPVPGARLTVYLANVISPLPVLFAEDANGNLVNSSNPVLSGESGEYAFIAQPGEYQIRVTGSSAALNVTKTITEYIGKEASSVVPVTLNRQVFTDNATWTAPAGVIQATVTCVGSGGGGGGGSTNAGASGGGAGGSGGATIRRTVTVNPLQGYAIVIGAAGSGSPAGSAGTAGGNTTFGTLVLANGGNGGGSSAGSGGGLPSTPGNGTLVGIGGGSTITFTTSAISILNGYGAAISGSQGGGGGLGTTGNPGSNGTTLETYAGGLGGAGDAIDKGGGGGGGCSAFGTGGTGGVYGGAASQPPGVSQYGAGGGGGAALAAGAAGSKGLCIVEWIS